MQLCIKTLNIHKQVQVLTYIEHSSFRHSIFIRNRDKFVDKLMDKNKILIKMKDIFFTISHYEQNFSIHFKKHQ